MARTYTDSDGIVHVQHPSANEPKRFNSGWDAWDAAHKTGAHGDPKEMTNGDLGKAYTAAKKEHKQHYEALVKDQDQNKKISEIMASHPDKGRVAQYNAASSRMEALHQEGKNRYGPSLIDPTYLPKGGGSKKHGEEEHTAGTQAHSEGWDKWNSSYGMTPQVIQPGQMPAMAAMQQAGMQPGMAPGMGMPQQAAAPRPKAAPAGAQQQQMQPGMGGMQPGMDQGVGMLPAPGLAIHTDDKSTMKQDANGNAHVEVNPDKRGSAWANPDHVKAALRGAEPGDNINAVHSEGQAVFGKVEKLGPTSVTIAAEKHGEIASPTDGKSVVVRHDRIHELTVEKGKPGEGGDSGDSAPAGDAGKKMTEGYYDVDGIFHRRVGVKA